MRYPRRSEEGGMQMIVVLFDQKFTFFTYTEPKASKNLCMHFHFCIKYESEKPALYFSFLPNGIYVKCLSLSILM